MNKSTKPTKTMFDDYSNPSSEIRKLPSGSNSDSGNALISHDTYVLVRKEYEEAMESDSSLVDPFPLWQSLTIYFKDGELNPAPKKFEIEELTKIGWLQITIVGNSLYFFLEDGTQGYCEIY